MYIQCVYNQLMAFSHPPTPRGTWGNFGETRGGVRKVVCWSTKVAISLKRVQIEEKLLWAYRNLPTLFPKAPSPTPYGLPFPKIRVRTPPKTPIVIMPINAIRVNYIQLTDDTVYT